MYCILFVLCVRKTWNKIKQKTFVSFHKKNIIWNWIEQNNGSKPKVHELLEVKGPLIRKCTQNKNKNSLRLILGCIS